MTAKYTIDAITADLKPQHTPGPWYFRPDDSSVEAQTPTGYNFRVANCADSFALDSETMKANAERIVACVNACEGIPDPEKVIRNMKGMLEDAAFQLERLTGDNLEVYARTYAALAVNFLKCNTP